MPKDLLVNLSGEEIEVDDEEEVEEIEDGIPGSLDTSYSSDDGQVGQ